MPFFIAHVSGSRSSKQVLIDSGDFETVHEAEDAAKSRWPNGDYFVVEAEDKDQAGSVAIAESRGLD